MGHDRSDARHAALVGRRRECRPVPRARVGPPRGARAPHGAEGQAQPRRRRDRGHRRRRRIDEPAPLGARSVGALDCLARRGRRDPGRGRVDTAARGGVGCAVACGAVAPRADAAGAGARARARAVERVGRGRGAQEGREGAAAGEGGRESRPAQEGEVDRESPLLPVCRFEVDGSRCRCILSLAGSADSSC